MRGPWIGYGEGRGTEAAPPATEHDLRAQGCRWIGGGAGPCGAIGCCRVWETWRGAVDGEASGLAPSRRPPSAPRPPGRRAAEGSNGRPTYDGSNGRPATDGSHGCLSDGSNGEPPSRASRRC